MLKWNYFNRPSSLGSRLNSSVTRKTDVEMELFQRSATVGNLLILDENVVEWTANIYTSISPGSRIEY